MKVTDVQYQTDREHFEEHHVNLEISLHDEKSRNFILSYGYQDDNEYSKIVLIEIVDKDNSVLKHLKDDMYYSENIYTFENAIETQKILDESLDFVKNKVREYINQEVSEKKIDLVYKNIEYLNEILKMINKKIFETESKKNYLLKKYKLD